MVRPQLLFHSPASDPSWPARLQAALPDMEVVTDLDIADAARVMAAVVWAPPRGALARFGRLRLIQVLGAGVDQLLHDASLPADVPVARLLDPALARLVGDYVLLHALALHRGLYRHLALQAERRWVYEPPRLTSQSRVAVLGLGEIGSRCLAQLEAAGFRVTGWSARPKPHLAGKAVSGPEALPDLLAGADIVAALLPSTPTTRNLFGRPLFAAMKRGAGLINAGRGDLVVDEDLLWALDEGILAHAVLDVARTEPLPGAHPFWGHPRVTLTPHCAGATSPDVALDTIAGNIRAALRGAPLGGLIDRQRGY